MTKTKSGFTIVELLIVIVVIGILASIGVVSYNGSQARARNAKIASAAEQLRDGLENYLTIKKQYPAVSASSNYCLGIDVANCTTATASWVRSTTLETELQSIMDKIPAFSAGPGTAATSDPVMGYVPYRGTGSPTLDGVNSAFLIYILEGVTTCPVGPIASGSWPTYTSTVPAAGRTYGNSSISVCWVPLSKP